MTGVIENLFNDIVINNRNNIPVDDYILNTAGAIAQNSRFIGFYGSAESGVFDFTVGRAGPIDASIGLPDGGSQFIGFGKVF